VLGVPHTRLLGLALPELVHPDDAGGVRAAWHDLVRTPGARRSGTVRSLDAAGEVRWFELHVANRLNDPDVEGVIVNARDATIRARTDAERGDLMAQLGERVKEIGVITEAAWSLTSVLDDLDVVLGRLVALVPAGMRHPDHALARAVVERGLRRFEVTTPGYHAARRHVSSERPVDDGRVELVVAYPDGIALDDPPFMDEERRMLDTLTVALAGHVQRRASAERTAELQCELEARTKVQRALLDVYERFVSGGDEDVPAMVLDRAIATVPAATNGSVIQRSRDGTYRFAALRGYDEDALAEVRLPADEVLFGHDWSDGRSFVVRDLERATQRVERLGESYRALVEVTRAAAATEAMVAPVVVEGELVAAISLEHSAPEERFTAADGETLSLFAQSVGALLERSEARAHARMLARAVDASTDGIAIIDLPADGSSPRVHHANRAFADTFAFDLEHAGAWRPELVLDQRDAERVRGVVERVVRSGEAERFDVAVAPHGRAPAWIEVGLTRLDAGPAGARLLVAVRDVTERRDYAAELERLNVDLAMRLGEARTLEAIDAAIASGGDERDTLGRVVAQVRRRPDVAAARLWVSDERSGELLLAVEDAVSGIRFDETDDRSRSWPLAIQGVDVGRLEVVLTDATEPDAGWHRFMGVVAAQVAIAVSHVRMLGRLRDSARAYAALAEFSGAIEDVDDPDALIDLGVRRLLEEFGMDRAGYFELDGDHLLARRRWGTVDPEAARVVEVPQRAGEGAIGLAVATREPTYVRDYGTWEHATPGLAEVGFRSILALPVRHEGVVRAAIGLGSYGHTVALRDDQIAIARAFVRRLERALERVADQRQVQRTREEAFRALGVALEYRDYETKGHTDRVVALARRLGQRVGLGDADLEALAWGAYLHDLGKIAIADEILLKPARLTDEEFAQVKRHTVVGFDMSRDLAFLPHGTRLVVRSHHERWDGAGYPDGLAGDAIPYLARLFSLVDVYDALTSERPYKHAWSHEEAVAELAAQAGHQFDPELARAMLDLLAEDADPA
jgi:HD-GYP domain-containing protein (c-di-GMP phosphodiesterase class II)